MALSPRDILVAYLYALIAASISAVSAGDPSQQHPITVAQSPSCLRNWEHSTDSCNYTSTKVDDCSYRHCHVQLPTGCTDWWLVLDLNCLCSGVGSAFCNERCPPGLQGTMYFDWLANTCTAIPNWPGLPSDVSLSLPSSVVVQPTDFSVHNPSCLAQTDYMKLTSCVANTTEVLKWMPNDSRISLSSPWQLDQTCFCGNLTFSDVQNRSTCAADDDIAHAQLLIWLNSYCGSYNDFATLNMPMNWQDTIPVYDNVSDVQVQDLQNSWDLSGLNSTCESSFSSFVSQCRTARKCASVSDCGSPFVVVNRSCFCSSSYSDPIPNLSWCSGNHLNLLKACSWFEGECVNTPKRRLSMLLLPWSDEIRPSTLAINITTNVAIKQDSHCPSTAEKLGAFAVVNGIMALLVPLLGRRTVINKLTGGLLGHAHGQTWIATGTIGVFLHLASNAVNARIIKSTPGFEDISIRHLVLLWCTRPRIAWLVVAFVPVQASKAMYFAVTAATLTTESILQVIGSVYMVTVTNYGRQAHFYSLATLRNQFAVRSQDARTMYVGSAFVTVAVPFSVLVCAWSVFGIGRIVSRLPSYILHMESTVKRLEKQAEKHEAELARLYNNPNLHESNNREPDDIDGHYQFLEREWYAQNEEWRRLRASAMPISNQLRRDRRERGREAQRLTENQRLMSALHQADAASPWFEHPIHRVEENERRVEQAEDGVRQVEQHRSMLSQQIHATVLAMNQLRLQEKIVQQQIEEINAEALLLEDSGQYRQPFRGQHRQTANDLNAMRMQDLRSRDAAQEQHNAVRTDLQRCSGTLDQLQELEALYDYTRTSWLEFGQFGQALADGWKQVRSERVSEAERQRVDQGFILIPIVVVISMLITFIAQWVWWVGYVRVARDTYCPPKLVPLTAVWTVFSALGVMIGASV